MNRNRIIVGVLGYVCFSAIIIWLLPRHIVVAEGDFGYVESVAETIRSGHLVRSDWLAPLNLPLTLLSATLYSATGNFYLATAGLALACALANGVLIYVWLRPLLPRHWGGEALAWAAALCPGWLNKAVEFTGVPFSIACTVGALIAWRQRRRWLFLIAFVAAFLNRQNAVCLLAFPAIEAWREWRRTRRIWTHETAMVLFGVFFVGLVSIAIPLSYAERTVALEWAADWSAQRILAQAALGAILCLGIRAGWDLFSGRHPTKLLAANFRSPVIPLLVLCGGAWLLLRTPAELSCQAPGMAPWSGVIVMLSAVLAAGFVDRTRTLPLEALGYVGLMVTLLVIRGAIWDYYLIEPALVLVLRNDGCVCARGAKLLHVATLAACGCYAILLGRHIRLIEERFSAYELGVRSGQVQVSEASVAPYSWLGWKLFHYSQRRASARPDLADFLHYVEQGRSAVVGGRLVTFPSWSGRSIHPSGELWPLPAGYEDRRFPLSNEEWREFLRGKSG